MATKVSSSDLELLKHHWTIHFLAQRLPKLVRQAMVGEYNFVRSGLANLPLGVAPLAVVAAYPGLKFNLPPSRTTKQKLFARVIENNRRIAGESRYE